MPVKRSSDECFDAVRHSAGMMLLLHGSNYNAAWDLVSEELTRYGRVIVYDQFPYTVEATLVIHGEGNQIVPLEDSMALAERIPGSTLSVIEGVGHLPHEESPDEFLRVVNTWMMSLDI